MWNERKDCLRMNEAAGWTSSRLTIRLLNLKRPQVNRVEQVLTGQCNLYSDKTSKLQVMLRILCVQNVAQRKHQITMWATASFTKIFVLNILESPKPLFTLWHRNVT